MPAIEVKVLGIKCDNVNCNYKDELAKVEDYEEFLNKPCPECGEILLTEADYNATKFILGVTEALAKKYPDNTIGPKYKTNVKFNGTGSIELTPPELVEE